MLDKCTMRTEVLYNDEKTHRYSLKKSWDSSKPSASVIMISPSDRANEICLDMTTMYTVNNCYRQGFGSVEILNLYSKINAKPFETDLENNERIIDSCKKADKIIFAWGKGQTKNDILFRIMEILKLLEPYKDKIYEISDESGKNGYHPLGASVRLNWILVPFQYPKSETKTKSEK